MTRENPGKSTLKTSEAWAPRNVETKRRKRGGTGKGTPLIPTEEIIEAITICKGNLSAAAVRLGCSRSTLNYRMERYQEISDCVDSFRKKLVDDAETKLQDHIDDGNFAAVQFVLKTLGRERGYVTRKEYEVSGGATIVVRFDKEDEGL